MIGNFSTFNALLAKIYDDQGLTFGWLDSLKVIFNQNDPDRTRKLAQPTIIYAQKIFEKLLNDDNIEQAENIGSASLRFSSGKDLRKAIPTLDDRINDDDYCVSLYQGSKFRGQMNPENFNYSELRNLITYVFKPNNTILSGEFRSQLQEGAPYQLSSVRGKGYRFDVKIWQPIFSLAGILETHFEIDQADIEQAYKEIQEEILGVGHITAMRIDNFNPKPQLSDTPESSPPSPGGNVE